MKLQSGRGGASLAGFVLCALAVPSTLAASGFVAFQGGAEAEAAWRAAAGGNVPIEDFEGFANATPVPCHLCTDQVIALPLLGIRFESDLVGAYPGVYVNGSQAHSGDKQLANFGGGLGQFADYRILPASGRAILAVGFWQCDPQGDLVLEAYDRFGNDVGHAIGLINNGSGNSFGGFVSEVPIYRIVVRGNEGDGWNHLDDLQAVSVEVCPCDLNSDGFVDDADFVEFILSYNLLDCSDPSMPPTCPSDFNADTLVDDGDFVLFVAAYNDLVCP